jgi:hypothetical protein
VIDALQAPLAAVDPLIGLAAWSIPSAVFALLVFKWGSDQRQLAAVKRRIAACLFEIRLFNDDLRAILRAQGELLRHLLRYQWLALRPMLWLAPPFVLLVAHLHAFYGFAGLAPGGSTLVRVELSDEWRGAAGGVRPEARFDLPSGLLLETPVVWTPSLGELTWRIAAQEQGSYALRLRIAGSDVVKNLRVTDRLVRLSPVRSERSLLAMLEWPSEPPLARAAPVRSISVSYPDRRMLGMTWRYAWMVVYFALTTLAALVLRRPLGVEL